MNYNITIEKIDTNKLSIDGYSMPGGKYHVQVSREDKVFGGFAPLGGAYCDYSKDIMENVIEFLENDLNDVLTESEAN